MNCHYACGTAAHLSRRSFLQGATTGALGMLGFSGMVQASAAQKLASQQKQVVVFFLKGGVSQLETWDPKPGTDTGGPFQKISTSAPGVEICELLPHTARQMQHLALIRGINTKENDHGKGAYIMQTGYRQQPGFEYPYLGSAFSRQLNPPDSPLPGYICLGAGARAQEAAFLGPKYAPLALPEEGAPQNLARPASLTEQHDMQRRLLRQRIGQRFAPGRRDSDLEAYNSSYEQAARLMARSDVFDFSKMPAKDEERYGKHSFARNCRVALRLLENGVTFIKVSHTNYDTHSENFNFHIEQLGEFDRPFATFMADLHERGMLQHTLVIVMSEFGRTPNINSKLGRDHWGTAWSIALGGCGIKGGAVVGKTNEKGTQVIDREVNGGHLFHTYYHAVGLDSSKSFYDKGRPVAKADPKTDALQEILV